MQQSPCLIRFPLAKYSRAVDVTKDVATFTWSHVTRDLILVIDTFRGADNGSGSLFQMLKVFEGTRALETIPIQEMIAQCEEAIKTMQGLNIEVRNEQLPISALVRNPLFALRYNLPDGKIRRLQLKFASGQDFESACHHLRLLGLRMSSSEQRPSIGSASSPTTPTNNASLSCPPERLAELYNRPRTTGTSVSSASSSNAPRLSSPLARHSFTSASHVQEPTAAIRPISASSETIWAGMGSNHTMTPTVQSDPLVPPVYFQRPNSSSSTLDRPSSSITAERERLTTLPTINGDSASSILRPESSDLRTHHNLPSLLPPRRELPFARSTPPKSSGSDTIRASSRSLSGSMRPPPIPASSPRLSRMSSVEQLARGEPTTPRIVQPTFDANIMHMSRPASSPSPRTSVVTDPPPLPKPTFVDDARKSACAASSPPIYCTSNTSDNQNATPLRQISISAQNTFPSTPCALSPTLAQSEASYQDRILPELFYNAHANENLASYSMRPQEDRMAILNDFMMQQIDDDNFINLVEDVSVCWARIGLGLG